jgi:hypothetical protein
LFYEGELVNYTTPTLAGLDRYRLPFRIYKYHLNCISCNFRWISATTNEDLYLFEYNRARTCSFCIDENEKRKIIENTYDYYFDKVSELWDVRYKDLYIKVYRQKGECCICPKKVEGDDVHMFYSFGDWRSHLICLNCFERGLNNRNLVYNCKCGYEKYILEPESSDSDSSGNMDSDEFYEYCSARM